MQKNHLHILLLIALLALQVSCASKKNVTVNETVSEELPPKLIFLNYTVSKDDHGNKHIQFINKIIADGKLKNHTSNESGVAGDLVCVQLDKKSTELQRIIIKNPLNKSIEFLDESNSFQRKQIDLDSTEFSIRLQLNPNTKYISITDFCTFENQGKPLIKTEIY